MHVGAKNCYIVNLGIGRPVQNQNKTSWETRFWSLLRQAGWARKFSFVTFLKGLECCLVTKGERVFKFGKTNVAHHQPFQNFENIGIPWGRKTEVIRAAAGIPNRINVEVLRMIAKAGLQMISHVSKACFRLWILAFFLLTIRRLSIFVAAEVHVVLYFQFLKKT